MQQETLYAKAMIKYFYISNGMPSALFDSLEAAEASAELQLSHHIKFYSVTATHVKFIYSLNRSQESLS